MNLPRNFLIPVKERAYEEGRNTDGAFYAGLFEVVIHDMPREEAEVYINELRRFYNNGWKEYF